MREDSTTIDELDTRLIWAGLFFALAIYAKFPIVDVLISSKFFLPNNGFAQAENTIVTTLYRSLPIVCLLTISIRPLSWMFKSVAWRKTSTDQDDLTRAHALQLSRHRTLLTLAVLVLGPGLIVQATNKYLSVRPTPHQLQVFGGDQAFVGTFDHGAEGNQTSSRIGAAPSLGFSLIALGLGCPMSNRKRWFRAGFLAGSMIGAFGIAMGQLFASDVIFSFYVVWISYVLVDVWGNRLQRHNSPQFGQ